MRRHSPQISVLMSVYNARPFLAEAIESILAQTFADFEFLIMDDGSSDNSGRIISHYARRDKRLRVFSHKNQGLTKSLNRLLKKSRAPFIARSDADSLSHPKRLKKEIAEFQKNNKIAAVTSYFSYIDRRGRKIADRIPPTDQKKIIKTLREQDNPLCHPSAVIRRSVLQNLGGWREDFYYAQDYDLWLRMLDAGYGLRVVPEDLVRMRITAADLAKRHQQRYFSKLARQSSRCRLAGRDDSITPAMLTASPRYRLPSFLAQLLFFKHFHRFDI